MSTSVLSMGCQNEYLDPVQIRFNVACIDNFVKSGCVAFASSQLAKATHPDFTKLSIHATYGRGSVLLWRQWNTLCTSGFCGWRHFSYNGPHVWRWQYGHRRHAEASSQNFQRIRQRTTHCLTLSSYTMTANCKAEMMFDVYDCLVLISKMCVTETVNWLLNYVYCKTYRRGLLGLLGLFWSSEMSLCCSVLWILFCLLSFVRK